MPRSVLLIIFIGFVSFACNNRQPPEHLIAEDTYINLLIELRLLESYQNLNLSDSLAVDSLMQQIFKKYGVTKQQFKNSHRYYQYNADQQGERIDEAIERLRKDRIRQPDSVAVDNTSADNH